VELVRFIVRDILARKPSGEARPAHDPDLAREVEALTEEIVTWINRSLPRDYAWPGNFRELGQCVRNVMIRGSYRPASRMAGEARKLGPAQELLDQVRGVAITADELLSRYYALAFDRADGNYREAGRRLGVDWRVIKARLDQAFLGRLRQTNPGTDRSAATDPERHAE
jgi:DNA-binding NtrC family response regulator